MPIFVKVEGKFTESKDQVKAGQGVSKKHLLNQKKNLQYLLNFHKYLPNASTTWFFTIQKH